MYIYRTTLHVRIGKIKDFKSNWPSIEGLHTRDNTIFSGVYVYIYKWLYTATVFTETTAIYIVTERENGLLDLCSLLGSFAECHVTLPTTLPRS